MRLACDAMRINPRDSIYFTAVNAFGEQNTNKYVNRTSFFFFDVLVCFCKPIRYYNRYNIFKRIETLLGKVTDKKPLKMNATFLPKYKRVLVKHPKRVLNKPKKKKKNKNPPKNTKPVVNNLLESQSSITPVDELLDSQCSLAFMDSQGRFTTSQTSPVCMH